MLVPVALVPVALVPVYSPGICLPVHTSSATAQFPLLNLSQFLVSWLMGCQKMTLDDQITTLPSHRI